MVYALTSSVLQPVFGYFLDRSGKTWLILFTLPGSALLICAAGLMPHISLLFLCVAAAGIISAVFHPLASGLLGRVIPVNRKGAAMSIFIGGGNFGFAIAPAVVILVLLNYGIPSLLWLAIPGFLMSVVYYRMGIHRIRLADRTPASFPPGPLPQTTPVPWYRSRKILNLNLVMGLRSWMQVALSTLLPLWMAHRGLSPALAATLLTAFLASGATGGLLGGWLGDRFGHKRFIIASMAACLPALYLFFSTPELSWFSWVLIVFAGACLQGTMPSSIVWAQELMPNKAAMASGMMLGLSFGLGGLGTAVTAAAADVIGLDAAMMWTLLPYALAIPLAFSVPAELTKQEVLA
jgi:FSR family fosmidomycin resistance protein-like MFS transporter